ncbi:MAG: invasion associated locus B family protein [Bdellovibrionales bacterium]
MRLLILILCLITAPALAATNTKNRVQAPKPAAPAPVETAQYRAWAAFSYDESGAPTCYAVVRNAQKGRTSYAYITHWPSEKSENVFQYTPGVELKLGSTATLNIDGSQFTLFTTDRDAWAKGSENDRAIMEAIRKGNKMLITATTASGKKLSDTFSLSGSGLAIQAISKMCGVPL